MTHNHPEGIKGAVVTAVCIWMARHGKTKEDIFQYVLEQYPAEKYEFSIAVPLDELEKIYQWNETCMGSVPAAMCCFYESDSYESFLRNVFRLKCDSDTLAAIGGDVAEEYYGWTGFYNEDELLKKYLDANLYNLVKLLCLFVLCLHWMNPVAYLLLFLYIDTAEIVSDSAAVDGCTKEKRQDYANLLVLEAATSDIRPAVWKNNLSGHKRDVTERDYGSSVGVDSCGKCWDDNGV